MLEIERSAQQYLAKLIADQDDDSLAIRLDVVAPGTPKAEVALGFIAETERETSDVPFNFPGGVLYVAEQALPWMTEAKISLIEADMQVELKIVAPKLKGDVPDDDAPLEARVQHLIDTEINPGLAAHKGYCRLVEITDQNALILQFGGGCHGCGMVDVTLKQGIEKHVKTRFPEIVAVLDATDHATGTNPYY